MSEYSVSWHTIINSDMEVCNLKNVGQNAHASSFGLCQIGYKKRYYTKSCPKLSIPLQRKFSLGGVNYMSGWGQIGAV